MDFIILAVVLGALGIIAYFNFIKKDKDVCSKCAYKREGCNCNNKNKKWIFLKKLHIINYIVF